MTAVLNYGPLTQLMGTWQGNKGQDVAPEPDGEEHNAYYETLTFLPAGDVSNAEEQDLIAVHYHQVVQRQSDDKVIHNETGYWVWDEASELIMQSFAIPRGIAVIAGGNHQRHDATLSLSVQADHTSADWKIIESPFMQKKAKTLSFSHTINVTDTTLNYTETTLVDIYDKTFEHTDQNTLTRVN
jgi:hypothetical protein